MEEFPTTFSRNIFIQLESHPARRPSSCYWRRIQNPRRKIKGTLHRATARNALSYPVAASSVGDTGFLSGVTGRPAVLVGRVGRWACGGGRVGSAGGAGEHGPVQKEWTPENFANISPDNPPGHFSRNIQFHPNRVRLGAEAKPSNRPWQCIQNSRRQQSEPHTTLLLGTRSTIRSGPVSSETGFLFLFSVG